MFLLRIINTALIVYIVILSLRIIGSWFRGISNAGPWDLLTRVTDPYLSLFSGIGFLRRGMFDFTPIAAILVLVVLQDLTSVILFYEKITLGIFLGSVIRAVWSGVSFLLWFFLILGIIKLVLLYRGTGSTFSEIIGRIMSPLLDLIERYIPTEKKLSEIQYVYISIGILFAMSFLGGFLIRFLVNTCYNLPL